MRWFSRLFRALLCLLPRHFREQHGAQALRIATRRVREETGVHRGVLAGRELLDLLLSAPRIRRDLVTPRFDEASPRREGMMSDGFLSDIRYATRSLLRTRGFLTVSLTTLGAGIGLCATVMVLVNAYLVRGLPYPESDRLFHVQLGGPGAAPALGLERLDWTALADVIEHPISWDLDLFNLRGAPYPEAAQGTWVTPGYMAGFGVRPAMGRRFEPADFAAAAAPVALISHRMWQSRFGGDPAIVGRRLEAYVDDRPNEPQGFTIVGVLPEGLWHLNIFTEVMAPLRAPSYPYMARLRAGVTPAVAAERIDAFVRAGGITVPAGWQVGLESAHASYVRQIRPLLTALATATGLVMLIACANVAVLFTVRATERRREIAVRKALGAAAGRITRALVSEALVVGMSATLLGLALAQAVVSATAPVMDRFLGRSAPGGAGALAIDAATLGGTLVIGLIVTAVCCAAQLWTSGRAPLALALTGGQKGSSAPQRRAHATLIAVEVAACLTLLVGAALMVQSGLHILAVEMGLESRDVMVGRFSLSQRRYPDAASRIAIYDRVRAGVSEMADTRGVAFTNWWPLQAAPPRTVGRDEPQAAPALTAGMMAVSQEYFETLQIALKDGRGFEARDGQGAERVAVVSQTLADRLWPGGRAIGQRLRVAPPQGAPPEAQAASLVVVGVAADVRHAHTDTDLADLYVSIRQYPTSSPFLYVSASRGTALEIGLRALLARLDPDLAIGAMRPLSDILDQQRAGPRFLTGLLAIFAGFSALLALLGIYGVIAYTVRQREREIAVRLAIGADRAIVTKLFLREGSYVLGAGLALGVLGALMLGRLLQTQLFDVQPSNPMVIAGATLVFATCGLVAIGWPARAAASTDPAKALRD